MPDTQKTILDAIQALMGRKNIEAEVRLDSSIHDDLGLDSLDVAELSAILEDDLGRDPYSQGTIPHTVGEIVEWYKT